MIVSRIFDLVENYLEKYPYKTDVFAGKENKVWRKVSTSEFKLKVDLISSGLIELGLKSGDKVATISNSRPEWNLTDHAILQAGMIHVPIYPTLSIDDYKYILEHSEISCVFISDKLLIQKLKPLIINIPKIQFIYTYNEVDGEKNFKEVIDLGSNNIEKNRALIENIKKSISENDLATIIYTSGTTGVPKGVMLSHRNIVTNFASTSFIQPLNHNHRALSFLPLCHVYERVLNYQYQYLGISIYYAENMGTIADNIKEVKPHCFSTVPRLLERIYDKIISAGKDLTGFKKKLFFWALELAHGYELNRANGIIYSLKLSLARKLIFSKWKEGLGGNTQLIVSGGAALQVRLAKVFWASGMKVIEGYGLTETSPIISVNHLHSPNVKFGTVGPIISDVTVKIANDGEILCKGPNVMMGYYKDSEATKEIIDSDGFLHTGDIGTLVDDKFLKITDRKKEIFKSSSGKYIAPQIIENKLKESDVIEQCIVIGENQKFASAIISPNFNFLHFWAAKHKIHYTDNRDLANNPKVIERVQREVNCFNKSLALHEQVKRIRVVGEEWSVQSGELSQTLKLRRKFIQEKYADSVKSIYLQEIDN
ncbi:MAG: AMP-dependent synthetase [Bacteroidetes bacterium GWA2_31_9]|nr:MAG: AMP-dependent synthetase [Bacteroidetes bacterium GWA2_31_9]